MRLEEPPRGSEEVLLAIPGFGEAARWVRWHHERPDGLGYPDRLPGEWIPIEAKILGACSFYASLVLAALHTRARGAAGLGMRDGQDGGRRGRQAFLRFLDEEAADYASASDTRFSYSTHDHGANALSSTWFKGGPTHVPCVRPPL